MRAREAIDWATGELGQCGAESAKQESEILFSTLFDCERLDLYLDNRPLGAEELSWIKKRLKERKEGKPLQYLLGTAYFMGLEFEVNPDVLIPRPETEILVEAAIEKLKKIHNNPFSNPPNPPFNKGGIKRGLKGRGNKGCGYQVTEREKGNPRTSKKGGEPSPALIIDMGTGSGNIAIAIAKLCPRCRILGLDISLAALKAAKRNALKHKVDKHINFALGDGFAPLKAHPALSCSEENPEAGRSWASADMIISNPPYIKSANLAQPQSFGAGFGRLPREIGFEPGIALDGGEDGLDFYRRIIREGPDCLKKGGELIMEIGDNQANDVSKMLSASGKFGEIETVKDYNNIERVIAARKVNDG